MKIWEAITDSPLVDMTWRDQVDILLLTVVIYRVLIAMRGTRALQSLFGIALLGVLYLASDVFGLTAVHWVLDNLFVYVVLALLILFQEDIRRALARTGGQLFASAASAVSDANLLEELVKVSFALAHKRVGALIVIERSGSLEPFLEGARIVDGVASGELLQAIFHPSSPLHDGAVVIRKGRVAAASVFLPISLSKDVARAFGTRHRAALGITEQTDGLCIVISEERGTVAIASRGEISPVADMADLRQQLAETLEDNSEPEQAVASA